MCINSTVIEWDARSRKRGDIMLGFKDFWIFSAYMLCIASTIACIVYGLVNWNKEDREDAS